MPATFGDARDVRDARDVPAAKLETERGALSGSAGMAGVLVARERADNRGVSQGLDVGVEAGGEGAGGARAKARERQSRRA